MEQVEVENRKINSSKQAKSEWLRSIDLPTNFLEGYELGGYPGNAAKLLLCLTQYLCLMVILRFATAVADTETEGKH